MRYNGKINNINHIVVSDPTYGKDVWCRYENENIKKNNWIIDLLINSTKDDIGNYVVEGCEFYLLLNQNEEECKLDDNGILEYSKNIKTEEYTIGMDSACVALGINEFAKEIIDSKEEWQPECSLRTGTDGTFGSVLEGKNSDGLCFVLISGYIDKDFIDETELLEYLQSQFMIDNLKKQHDDSFEL